MKKKRDLYKELKEGVEGLKKTNLQPELKPVTAFIWSVSPSSRPIMDIEEAIQERDNDGSKLHTTIEEAYEAIQNSYYRQYADDTNIALYKVTIEVIDRGVVEAKTVFKSNKA